MTGAAVKQQLTTLLRSHVWTLEHVHEVEEACAEALAALEPCLVLTDEDAAGIMSTVEACMGAVDDLCQRPGTCLPLRPNLALLTPQKVDQV